MLLDNLQPYHARTESINLNNCMWQCIAGGATTQCLHSPQAPASTANARFRYPLCRITRQITCRRSKGRPKKIRLVENDSQGAQGDALLGLESSAPHSPAQPDTGATFCMAGGSAPPPSHKLMHRHPNGAAAVKEPLQLPTMRAVPDLQHDRNAEQFCGVCLQPPSAMPQCVSRFAFFVPHLGTQLRCNTCMCRMQG